MSHGLNEANSGMLAVARTTVEVPWHKHPSCTVLNGDQVPSPEEAIVMSKANYTVRKEQLFLKDGRPTKTFALLRDDNNEILTDERSVGPNYTIVQPRFSFNWFKPFIEQNQAFIETAGVLFGGRKIWLMCKLNRDPMVIKGNDVVEKWLLLSNSYDGTTAVRVGFTPVRVVCANTLKMAHDDKASELIRVKHTLKVEQNLENIRETIDAVNARFEATAEQYRLLAAKGINSRDLKKYIKKVFQMEEKVDKNGVKKLAGKTESTLLNVMSLFNKQYVVEAVEGAMEAGPGSDMKSANGTLWGAYNAVTNFLTHERGRTIDTRLDSLWFGASNKLNERALNLALQAL